MPAGADPELARRLAVETQRIYSEANAEMLARVARRLARGIDTPGWAEAKALDIGRLRLEVQRILAALDSNAARAITQALTEAFGAGAADTAAELGGGFARTTGRALDALVRETVAGVTGTHSAILRTTADKYREIVAEATTRISIGTETRREATARALQQFARGGIRGFVDTAGRQWEIETYAEMATRTASGRAAIAGSLERMEQRGIDLVIVSNAPEECKICRPWEGKVLSVSGNTRGELADGTKVAGTVAQAQAAGLQHSNCRHNLSAYVPGLTTAPTQTADPEGDQQRQRQRALERQVRAAKRATETQKAFVDQLKRESGGVDAANAQRLKKVKANQAAATQRLTAFLEETDRKRLRYRETVR